MDRRTALVSLLLKMFSAAELRDFVRGLHDGDTLSRALPGGPMAVAEGVVTILEGVGALDEPDVWARLGNERPRRRTEIDAVRVLFVHDVVPVLASPPALPLVSEPSILKILFGSASPGSKAPLRVGTEFRAILDKLRGARYSDRLKTNQITGLRFEDLRTGLLDYEPHILHLSYHGNDEGALRFESGDDGKADVVPKKNLIKLLKSLGTTLRLVVFNACHSTSIASDVAPMVGLSIGMSNDISDVEAIKFSVAFYEALAFGRSVETAFNAALAGLTADDKVPKLFPEAAQDIEQRRRLPLITGSL